MRKTAAIILVVIQLIVPFTFLAVNRHRDKELLEKGTDVVFRLEQITYDGLYTEVHHPGGAVEKVTSRLYFSIPFTPGYRSDGYNYITVVTGTDGISSFGNFCQTPPENGLYIAESAMYLEYFDIDPMLAKEYFIDENNSDGKNYFYIDVSNNGRFFFRHDYHNVFVTAKIYKDRVLFTDLIVDGESMSRYLFFDDALQRTAPDKAVTELPEGFTVPLSEPPFGEAVGKAE